MRKTTIQINMETLQWLKNLRAFERQSYDEVLSNIIDNIDDKVLTDEEIRDIKVALEDVRQGKVKPIEDVARELGISLG